MDISTSLLLFFLSCVLGVQAQTKGSDMNSDIGWCCINLIICNFYMRVDYLYTRVGPNIY